MPFLPPNQQSQNTEGNSTKPYDANVNQLMNEGVNKLVFKRIINWLILNSYIYAHSDLVTLSGDQIL